MEHAVTRAEVAALLIERAQAITGAIRDTTTPAGLAPEQWWILAHLAGSGAATMSELSGAAHTPAPTTTRLVDRLVESALVYRTLDGLDKRKVLVRITERGLEQFAELRPQIEVAIDTALGNLPGWRVEALAEWLRET